MKRFELTLPAVAFLDGSDGKTDALQGRTVLLHVRTASVVEILLESNVGEIYDGVPTKRFSHVNLTGVEERHIAVLHYSATLADESEDGSVAYDPDEIGRLVFRPVIDFYRRYLDNEDAGIYQDSVAEQN